MEKLLTEGLESLNYHLSCDNNVRNLRIGIILLSCINRLQANESEQFCCVYRKRVTDNVHYNHHDEYPSYLGYRIYISIPDCHKGDKHKIDGSSEFVLITAVLINIKILNDHEKYRWGEKHDQHFYTQHLHLNSHIIILVHLFGMKEYLNLGYSYHPRDSQEQETVPVAPIRIPKYWDYDKHLLDRIRREEEAASILSNKDSQRIVNQEDDSY